MGEGGKGPNAPRTSNQSKEKEWLKLIFDGAICTELYLSVVSGCDNKVGNSLQIEYTTNFHNKNVHDSHSSLLSRPPPFPSPSPQLTTASKNPGLSRLMARQTSASCSAPTISSWLKQPLRWSLWTWDWARRQAGTSQAHHSNTRVLSNTVVLFKC